MCSGIQSRQKSLNAKVTSNGIIVDHDYGSHSLVKNTAESTRDAVLFCVELDMFIAPWPEAFSVRREDQAPSARSILGDRPHAIVLVAAVVGRDLPHEPAPVLVVRPPLVRRRAALPREGEQVARRAPRPPRRPDPHAAAPPGEPPRPPGRPRGGVVQRQRRGDLPARVPEQPRAVGPERGLEARVAASRSTTRRPARRGSVRRGIGGRMRRGRRAPRGPRAAPGLRRPAASLR